MASTSRYGVSLKQLRDLMEFRGAEGVQKLNELGGVRGLIGGLNTSDSNGKTKTTNLKSGRPSSKNFSLMHKIVNGYRLF